MPSRKGSHDIAANVRGAFLRAMKMSAEDGRPLSTIMLELLRDDPVKCLETVAKFVPKEMLIEQTIDVQLAEMTDEAIASEIDRLIAGRASAGLAAGSGEETKH